MANVKVSQLTAKGSKIAPTDRVPIAQDDGGGTFSSKYVTGEQLFGYKKYVALLSQTGTSAPTATVLENTIGNIVWTRSFLGYYEGTLTGAFITNKTFIVCGSADVSAGGGDIALLEAIRLNSNTVRIRTFDNFSVSDDMLVNTSIEIRVYP